MDKFSKHVGDFKANEYVILCKLIGEEKNSFKLIQAYIAHPVLLLISSSMLNTMYLINRNFVTYNNYKKTSATHLRLI